MPVALTCSFTLKIDQFNNIEPINKVEKVGFYGYRDVKIKIDVWT